MAAISSISTVVRIAPLLALVYSLEEHICRGKPGPEQRRHRKLHPKCDPKRLLDPQTIPKYISELHIPPVIHDDNDANSHVEISLRQIEQQVLPPGFPKTKQWAYGLPHDKDSYMNPSGTIEATRNRTTKITWINELVKDPDACRCDPLNKVACEYLPHVIQDACGTPLIDQTLHWANPPMTCADGMGKSDCRGNTAEPYFGPVPIVVHVHGAHTTPESDGYPESWFLPRASNIPQGYAATGTFYYEGESDYDTHDQLVGCGQTGDSYEVVGNYPSTNSYDFVDPSTLPGRTTSLYTNDEPSGTLWYHDHTLGITRLNVHGAGAGFYIIRTSGDGETGLANGQKLPGPPAKYGEDPNDPYYGQKIREIPIVIQQKSFYDDGSLWYPANRQYFDGIGDGMFYGSNCKLDIPFLPDPKSDVPPIWNPEAFFNTMVVNGQTWPKLTVASERYRFRLLNAAEARFLNLALFTFKNGNKIELPIYVIGSDQGLLPFVTKIKTGSVSRPNGPPADYTPPPPQGLLISPSERYDVIVDFGTYELDTGDEVYLVNTGPDSPFGGWEAKPDGSFDPPPADENTTGQVMKFIVDKSLNNKYGDPSTDPEQLILSPWAPAGDMRLGQPDRVRHLSLFEEESTTMRQGGSAMTFAGPVASLLGTPDPKRWMDPIDVTPAYNSVEIWEIENTTVDAHPIHIHQVAFQILNRWPVNGPQTSITVAPYEEGWKDTVIAYPGQVTAIKAKFDIKGLFVWHCHILAHEDNEMMLPFCVGECGVDCPASVCPAIY